MSIDTLYHIPVLLEESIKGLAINPNGIYVDATFGGGGHAKAILSSLDKGKLYAFDQDEESEKKALEIKDPNLIFIRANFKFLKRFLNYNQVNQVDGILADLGVSSHQINTDYRGFSTRLDGPLDMRMDTNSVLTARSILNTYPLQELTRLFREYGELRSAPVLAKAILTARSLEPIETTKQLVNILLKFPVYQNRSKFLAQVFQSIRIEVNQELASLQSFLEQTKELLKPAGRLVVISYHSLEDRLVKRFIRTGNFDGYLEKDIYGNALVPFKDTSKKVITPAVEEINSNSRARSAKLRAGERTNLL